MKNLRITVNGTAYDVQVEELGESAAPVAAAPAAPAAAPAPKKAAAPAAGAGEPVVAPMPGTILSVNVTAGQAVKSGDVLVILEAMKMENDITAPRNGVVKKLFVNEKQTVAKGEALFEVE